MDILPQLLVNSLITGSIYALASSGLSLTYGLLKVLNFAHGHMMMVGAYMFFLAHVMLGYGIVLSSLFTLVTMSIIAFLSLKIFVSPFLKLNLFLVFVTTLSLSVMLESLISIFFGVNVKSLTTGASVSSINIAGVYITPVQIFIVISSLVLMGLLGFCVHHTSYGRRVRAFSQHNYAAQTLGISRKRVTFVVFLTGTLLAAVAGVMVGYETNLQPVMGNIYTIKAFAAMILGGLGNIWGAAAGSYLLGLIENLSIGLQFGPYSIPAGYKDAFAFSVILLVLIFRPQGLFNKSSRSA